MDFLNTPQTFYTSQRVKKVPFPVLITASLLLAFPAVAEEVNNLKHLSLDELADIELSIASMAPNKVRETPAAVSVITRQDIQNSAATTIPDLLRMIPGMNVAAVNNNTKAVSSRGFHDVYSNKFLVMIDGRTVYTSLFSGVFWDTQDLILEDIERIEVIRGPGASTWGANAMNGVINIISRSSFDTVDNQMVATVGDSKQQLSLRHGGETTGGSAYRVWGKATKTASAGAPPGQASFDENHLSNLGFRSDIPLNLTSQLSLSGQVYDGQSDQLLQLTPGSFIEDEQNVSGGHLLGTWSEESGQSTLSLKAYFDYMEREGYLLNIEESHANIEATHTYAYSASSSLSYGGSLSYKRDDVRPAQTSVMQLVPYESSTLIASLFLQNESWVTNDLKLVANARLDRHEHSGWEFQPSLRALWRLDEDAEIWAAVSRSTRTPSRIERDLFVDGDIYLTGDPDARSEKLTAYELGYRERFSPNVTLDLTAFSYDYSQLTSVSVTGFNFMTLQPLATMSNLAEAKSYGFEAETRWDVTPEWSIQASYSWIKVDETELDANSYSVLAVNNVPSHQLFLQSNWQLSPELDLNLALSHVDTLDETGVPAYTDMDMRINWHATPDLRFSFLARNLFDDQHPEYIPSARNLAGGTQHTEVERSIQAMVNLRF